MTNNYSEYSNETLVAIWEEGLDLDENVYFVLGELLHRKHPNVKMYCYEILNEFAGLPVFEDIALGTLFEIDNDEAVLFVTENLDHLHANSIGTAALYLWYDTNEDKSEEKINLIKLIREKLKTLNENEIEEIKDYFNFFMESYKDF
ncbi:MAG: hypothetical protein GC193_07960 [Cryomorphaceae bacterium]|nr:hypothetical protein [Cryomorphaceae bacterium]